MFDPDFALEEGWELTEQDLKIIQEQEQERSTSGEDAKAGQDESRKN